MINIEIDIKDALEGIEARARAISKANISALNKLAAQGKTAASKKIREDYNIKAGDLSKGIDVDKATNGRLNAVLVGRGKHGIPLVLFGAKWTRPTMGKRGKMRGSKEGASVMVKVGNRKTIPGSFVATMKSGHVGLFKRIGKKRLPIKELYGPQPALLLGIPKVVQAVRDLVADKAEDVFVNELNYYAGK
jgi:hypothetical protein